MEQGGGDPSREHGEPFCVTEILGIDAVIQPEWEKSAAPESGYRQVKQERVRELGQRNQMIRSFTRRLPWSETKVDTDEAL